MNVLVDKTL